MLTNETLMSASCQGDGSLVFTDAQGVVLENGDQCKNIDNCQFPLPVDCTNGGDPLCTPESCKCEDMKTPSGNPFHDHTCHCADGFETFYKEGLQAFGCRNVNDCPTGPDACGGNIHGKCHDNVDQIHTYSCEPIHKCYHSIPRKKESGNATVAPIVIPISALEFSSHAKEIGGPYPQYASGTPDKDSIHFTSGQAPNFVKRSCAEGYTTNHDAKGPQGFDQQVMCGEGNEPHLSNPDKKCLPVNCGKSRVSNSMNPGCAEGGESCEIFFAANVNVICNAGHSQDQFPCHNDNCDVENDLRYK
jgi:hypothetical protein